MIAFWFGLLAGAAGLAVALYVVRGASDLTSPAEDEGIVETLWMDLSTVQRELADERDRADALARALWLMGCGLGDMKRANRALHAHDAARAAEVAR